MDNLRFSSAPTADSIDASIAQHFPDCEPVAVIGYACHFPESPDGETFWKNLLEGRECSRRFAREELLAVGLEAGDRDKQCSGRYLPGVILNAGNIQCFVRVQFQHVKAVQQFFELHSVLLSRMRLWKRILL